MESLSGLEGLCINGAHDAPHILSLSIPGLPTQNSINLLQDRGICVSAGSACAKGHRSHVLTAMGLSINLLQDRGICVSAGSACAKGHRSHVLTAMGLDGNVIDGSFRISLSRETTSQELEALKTAICQELLPRARQR